MKTIIFTLTFTLFFSSTLQAQRFRSLREERLNALHARRDKPHQPLLGLRIAGITACSVGSVVTLFGLLDYVATGDTGGRGSNTSSPAPKNNDGLVIVAAGGGLMAAGVVLIVVGVSPHNRNRISLITPKMNEIGLAYKF